MDYSIFVTLAFAYGLLVVACNGCQYCGCYGYPNCDCYCPPWMIIGDDHIILDHARGQVSVSSSAAASVKYNKGAPQAYISSLSSAKADPKIPVNIVGSGNATGQVSGETPTPTAVPPSAQPTGAPSVAPTTTAASSEVKTTWAYKPSDVAYGPANWGLLSPQCNGKHQSPIDISTATMQKMPLASKISMAAGTADPTVAGNLIVAGKLINNGKALGFNVDHTKTPVKLTGAIFRQETFTLRQFHFHIGCEGEMGSEHSLNGERFPGEIHLVFTNDKYPDAKTAMQQPNGLATLAFFIKYDPKAANPAFTRITGNLQNLRNPHGTVPLPDGISLTNMIPALKEGLVNLRRFAYKGSLPTPPCFETVTWVVFNRPVIMHPDAMERWRNLLLSDTDRICGNFRPVQPLNDRRVFGFVPRPQIRPATGPTAASQPTEAPLDVAGIVPVAKQIPLSKLVGGSAKASDDKLSIADARNELRTASANGNGKAADTNPAQIGGNVQGPADASQTISSAFSKTSSDKESKLIPQDNGKQESKKEADKMKNFGAKAAPAQIEKKNEDKNKPTVAPGMRRQF